MLICSYIPIFYKQLTELLLQQCSEMHEIWKFFFCKSVYIYALVFLDAWMSKSACVMSSGLCAHMHMCNVCMWFNLLLAIA